MSEVLFFLYSKYSPSCSRVMPSMHQLAAHYTIHFVDIDHPQTRQRLRKTDIKTVPCIIVKTPKQLDVVEAPGIPKLLGALNRLVAERNNMSAQMMYQPPPPPPPPMVSSIIDPSLVNQQQKQDVSFASSMNSRLQPQQISGPPPPMPAVTNQIVNNQGQPSAIASAAAMANEHHQMMAPQQTQLAAFQDPLAAGGMPPPQAPSAGGFAGGSMIDGGAAVGGNTFSTDGAYTPDMINGGQSQTGMRMDTQQPSVVLSKMQQMARERELEEQQYNRR